VQLVEQEAALGELRARVEELEGQVRRFSRAADGEGGSEAGGAEAGGGGGDGEKETGWAVRGVGGPVMGMEICGAWLSRELMRLIRSCVCLWHVVNVCRSTLAISQHGIYHE
jgi:hypothetical protein